MTIRTLDLWSWGHWFDSQPWRWQVVSTWMGWPWRGKTSVQLSYPSHEGK